MPSSPDPYSTLGLSKKADETDIKKAYRALAKKYHPDTNKGDKESERKFKEISSAYALLSDKEKKAQYDRGEIDADGNPVMGQQFYRGSSGKSGSGGFNPFGGSGGGGGFSDIFGGRSGKSSKFSTEDLFSDLFGKSRKAAPNNPIKGSDVTYRMTLPFLSAALGTKTKLTLLNKKKIEVTIPKGIEDGGKIRLKGKGNKGMHNGADGDALVEIHILPHSYFKRDGTDVLLDVPITLEEALTSPKIKIPTLTGSILLSIPVNVRSGQVLRVPKKGIDTGTKQGDLLVKILIQPPEKIDHAFADFIKQWYQKNPAAENIRKFEDI